MKQRIKKYYDSMKETKAAHVYKEVTDVLGIALIGGLAIGTLIGCVGVAGVALKH